MKPTPRSASGDYPDSNEQSEKLEQLERSLSCTGAKPIKSSPPRSNMEQEQLDALLDAGFAWEEAVTLLHLREHLYENGEVRQRLRDDPRLNFARWLYLNGEMNEGEQ